MKLPHRSGTYRGIESLDGTWSCAIDPDNAGIVERWYGVPRDEAHPAPVPGTIQQVFPGYHGIAWYWCEFIPARNPHPHGRHLLRFAAVDYRAEVWVNAERISTHDGAQSPFVLDITDSVRPGERNLLCVRVLNPSEKTIDDISIFQIPHRNKSGTGEIGSSLNYGGILGSVELLCRPALYISELIAKPNPQTGILQVLTLVINTLETVVPANLKFSVAASAGGETLQAGNTSRSLQPGQTLFETQVPLSAPTLWEPDDPYLYRLTARVLPDAGGRGDEVSTRFAFRDFRLSNNQFQLNGRRFLWKCARTLNNYPVGQAVPLDPCVLRRELLYLKAIGFNAVRFMAGLGLATQLDLCDELGLLVYEENYAAWNMQPSEALEEHFDRALRQMILRDRNHPSVAIWGLLTDTSDGLVFKRATESLPQAAFLDETRLIALNSGRADENPDFASLSNPGSAEWNLLPLGGDVHLSPPLPLTHAESDRIRALGDAGQQPVFLSDWRMHGTVNLLEAHRRFEQTGRSDSEDARACASILEQFFRDWEAWRLHEVFGRPEDFFSKATARAEQRKLDVLTAIRANPRVIGLTLGLADDSSSGTGVLTAFRDPRPAALSDVAEGLSALRWCLFAEPRLVAIGGKVKIEALLANQDALPSGMYPVLVQVFDSDNSTIFERRTILEVAAGDQSPLVLSAVCEELTIESAAGRYRIAASFEQGASAVADSLEFLVAPPLPAMPPETELKLVGEDTALIGWLNHRDIAFSQQSRPESGKPGQVVLVATCPPDSAPSSLFGQLADCADAGSTVVFLTPDFFRATDLQGWLPAGELATIGTLRAADDSIDAWSTNHQIFQGLSGPGLLDDRIFADLLPLLGFVDLDAGGQIVSAAHVIRFHPDQYRSGVLLSVHKHGAGKIVLNALRIVENLGINPAADHLLMNILRCAH
jgi:hypothetical protein